MIQERKKVYAKAFSELSEIIKYMKDELKNKIPNELKKDILEARDKDYRFTYNEVIPLYKQDLLPETKNLLSIIYSQYLCSEEEREKWKEYDDFCLQKQNEIRLNKYNPNDIFKGNYNFEKENVEKVEEIEKNLPIKLEKHTIFSRLKNYIQNFLFKIKKR